MAAIHRPSREIAGVANPDCDGSTDRVSLSPEGPATAVISTAGTPLFSLTYTTALPSGVQLGEVTRYGPSVSVTRAFSPTSHTSMAYRPPGDRCATAMRRPSADQRGSAYTSSGAPRVSGATAWVV